MTRAIVFLTLRFPSRHRCLLHSRALDRPHKGNLLLGAACRARLYFSFRSFLDGWSRLSSSSRRMFTAGAGSFGIASPSEWYVVFPYSSLLLTQAPYFKKILLLLIFFKL